jgi:hypothetical protein
MVRLHLSNLALNKSLYTLRIWQGHPHDSRGRSPNEEPKRTAQVRGDAIMLEQNLYTQP